MNDKRAVVADTDHAWEDFAAALTAAAYSAALRHGVEDKWLDLELDLWRVLSEAGCRRLCGLYRAGAILMHRRVAELHMLTWKNRMRCLKCAFVHVRSLFVLVQGVNDGQATNR